MTWLLHAFLHLPAWEATCALALLPLLESSTLFGIIVPGETALLIGGALVYRGHIGLVWMAVAGSVAAIGGDSIGYFVGRHWGDRLIHSKLGRRVGDRRWKRARRHLQKKGFSAVLFGRFGAWVRALVPMLAGTSHMPYGRFFAANAIGGTIWATGAVLAGWIAGAAWERAHRIVFAVGVVIFAILVVSWWRRR